MVLVLLAPGAAAENPKQAQPEPCTEPWMPTEVTLRSREFNGKQRLCRRCLQHTTLDRGKNHGVRRLRRPWSDSQCRRAGHSLVRGACGVQWTEAVQAMLPFMARQTNRSS